ncbi:MAG: hypothetical protein ACETWD_07950 [Desulfatiglandales bacterium]
MTDELKLEEYKQKWEYVRHSEEMQNKGFQWFLIIVGAIASFVFTRVGGFAELPLNDIYAGPFIFLALYAALLCGMLIFMKIGYESYAERLRKIEGKARGESERARQFPVFRIQYYLVALVGAACIFLAVYTLNARSVLIEDTERYQVYFNALLVFGAPGGYLSALVVFLELGLCKIKWGE